MTFPSKPVTAAMASGTTALGTASSTTSASLASPPSCPSWVTSCPAELQSRPSVPPMLPLPIVVIFILCSYFRLCGLRWLERREPECLLSEGRRGARGASGTTAIKTPWFSRSPSPHSKNPHQPITCVRTHPNWRRCGCFVLRFPGDVEQAPFKAPAHRSSADHPRATRHVVCAPVHPRVGDRPHRPRSPRAARHLLQRHRNPLPAT